MEWWNLKVNLYKGKLLMYNTRNKKIISILISFCLVLSFIVGVFGTKIDSYAEDVSITLEGLAKRYPV